MNARVDDVERMIDAEALEQPQQEQDVVSDLISQLGIDQINARNDMVTSDPTEAALEAAEGDEQAEPMSEAEVHHIAKQWLSQSSGGEADASSINAAAIKYYLGKMRGDEIKGRSKIISTDVADMVEASLSQITPMLTNPSLVEIDPQGDGDEDQAAEESRFCNHVVMGSNEGYLSLHNAIKSGLLQRMAAIEVFIDDTPDIQEQVVEVQDPMALQMIMQPTREGEKVFLVSNQGSQVTLKRVVERKRLRLEAILPENLRWIECDGSDNPQDSLFVARRRVIPRGNLILMGFDQDVVETIPAFTGSSITSTNETHIDIAQSEQPATDLIEVFFCYCMIDSDGDGIAERREVVLAGNEGDHFLDDQPTDIVPIAFGSPFLMPGQIEGLGLYDKVKSIQDGKTVTLRQWLDNMNMNNNRRVAVDVKGVQDPDSVFESKPASVIKCKRNPSEVVFPVPVDDIGPSCQNALNYFDTMTAHRAGAALDMQTQQQTLQGDTAHGIERQMTAKELMVSMMARNLGETLIKRMYAIVHHLLRTRYSQPLQARMQGQWRTTQPSQWRPRDSFTVNVGMTQYRKQQHYAVLQQTFASQLQLMQMGSPLVNQEKVHNTLTDMIETGLDEQSARYWIDPQSPEGQQAQQMAQQAAQKQQQQMEAQQAALMDAQVKVAQAEVMKANAQLQKNQMQATIDHLRHQLEELKAMSQEGKNVAEMNLQYDKLYSDIALKLTEIETNAGVQLNAQYLQNQETVADGSA